MKNNKYGYKICYREYGKLKLKLHLICNSYELAVWEIQYYENNPQTNRKTNKQIIRPEWYILPIKTFFEYKWLWRGCPF